MGGVTGRKVFLPGSFMVSLNWVTTSGFAILAILCVCVFLGMRRMPSLAWLVATAVIATIETVFLANAQFETVSSNAVAVLTPLAYICFGEAIRAALGQRSRNWWLYGAVAVFTIAAVSLKLADVPFSYRTPVFQIACALALWDGIYRLAKLPTRSFIDHGLIGVVGGLFAIFIFRAVTYPFIYGPDVAYAVIRAGDIERATLMLSALLSAVAILLTLARIINGVIVAYRRRSELDSLTGLLNHQAFHQLASVAGKTGGSVIFCDIDHFKSINDRFGHSAGDKALCAFAELLRLSGYQTGRLGGEEFAVLVPGGSIAVAMIEADRLRKKFSDLRHANMPGDLRITASFGIAEYEAGAEPRQAFSKADAALYAAKSSGRNRVSVHQAESVKSAAA